MKRLKKGEQDSPWASPLANYWTLARLDPLCKAGGKQEEEEKKKEQMAVRGKMDISGSQKGKSERVGRKRHGGATRELSGFFPKVLLKLAAPAAISWPEDTNCCYQIAPNVKHTLSP